MNYILIYVIVGVCIAYILKHQLDTVALIPTKADVKMRNKTNKKKDQLKFYIKLCPVWPLLIIKEVYDEIKERRKS
jgi:hypothetical protein